MTRSPDPRTAFGAGVRAIAPLAVGIVPFGLAYGAAVVQSGAGRGLGTAASIIVLAGAAQLSLFELIEADAHWIVTVGTALVINSRFLLYSAAVAPAFAEFPGPWRYLMAHMLTDQSAAVGLFYFERQPDPRARRWFFLGAGVTLASCWLVGTVAGVAAGSGIPDSWDVGFAIPLMFTALLVPSIRSRPMLVAAVVGAAVATAGAGLPNGTNVMAGAVCGIAVGGTVGGTVDGTVDR